MCFSFRILLSCQPVNDEMKWTCSAVGQKSCWASCFYYFFWHKPVLYLTSHDPRRTHSILHTHTHTYQRPPLFPALCVLLPASLRYGEQLSRHSDRLICHRRCSCEGDSVRWRVADCIERGVLHICNDSNCKGKNKGPFSHRWANLSEMRTVQDGRQHSVFVRKMSKWEKTKQKKNLSWVPWKVAREYMSVWRNC